MWPLRRVDALRGLGAPHLLSVLRGGPSATIRPLPLHLNAAPRPPPAAAAAAAAAGGCSSSCSSSWRAQDVSSSRSAAAAAAESGRPLCRVASSPLGCMCSSSRGFAVSLSNPSIQRGVLYPRVPQPFILVVLLRSVPGVGAAGDVCYVRRGFFRHSLARRGWALPATWQNIDKVQQRMQLLQQQRQPQQERRPLDSTKEAAAPGVVAAAGAELGAGATAPAAAAAGAAAAGTGAAAAGDLKGGALFAASAACTGGGGIQLQDEGGPVLSWMRGLRLRLLLPTEETDAALLLRPLTPQLLLQELADREGLDLLHGDLRLLRWTPATTSSSSSGSSSSRQQGEGEGEGLLLGGAPLGPLLYTGLYDFAVLLRQKQRVLVRCIQIDVQSQQAAERVESNEPLEGETEKPLFALRPDSRRSSV
ncbi:hypothetical protein Efla_007136 [Eimeria flavescens]